MHWRENHCNGTQAGNVCPLRDGSQKKCAPSRSAVSRGRWLLFLPTKDPIMPRHTQLYLHAFFDTMPKEQGQGCSSFLKRLKHTACPPNFLPFPKVWPNQRCVTNILPTLNEQEPTKSQRSLEHSPHCVACVGKMFIKCSYLFGAPPCDSRLTNKTTALREAIRLYTSLLQEKAPHPPCFWHLLAIDHHHLIVREKAAHTVNCTPCQGHV